MSFVRSLCPKHKEDLEPGTWYQQPVKDSFLVVEYEDVIYHCRQRAHGFRWVSALGVLLYYSTSFETLAGTMMRDLDPNAEITEKRSRAELK